MPSSVVPSFEKFNYLLRPAKQVERKLILQGLQALMRDGVPVDEYTYLGFGSVFYADFVMLHKAIGMRRMICVEAESIERRMRFNIPFGFVDLQMGTLGTILPDLPRDRRYLAWLDYDYVLNASVLADLGGLLKIAGPGSIVVVTVEAEPRLADRELNKELSKEDREERALKVFRAELSSSFGRKVERRDLSPRELPRMFSTVMRNYIHDWLATKGDLQFLQLFNTHYADNARMLTFGGIVAGKDEIDRLKKSKAVQSRAISRKAIPEWIGVPPLTIREKFWLDQRIRGKHKVAGSTIDLPQDFVENYCKYYREYPVYSEVWV